MRYLIATLVLAGACDPAPRRPSASAPVATSGEAPVAIQGESPSGPFGLGRSPSRAEVAAWSINVNPDGTNLPAGRGTAGEGKAVYEQKCAICHGLAGEGSSPLYPKLVDANPKDFRAFDTDFRIAHTIGNYWPYATTLYDYIRRTMPLTAPGSLKPDETYAVVAYLLHANGVIAEDAVINARTLPQVRMPARDHFEPDNREGGAGFR